MHSCASDIGNLVRRGAKKNANFHKKSTWPQHEDELQLIDRHGHTPWQLQKLLFRWVLVVPCVRYLFFFWGGPIVVLHADKDGLGIGGCRD